MMRVMRMVIKIINRKEKKVKQRMWTDNRNKQREKDTKINKERTVYSQSVSIVVSVQLRITTLFTQHVRTIRAINMSTYHVGWMGVWVVW